MPAIRREKMRTLDKDEFEFVCSLINQRLFDLEDGETKYPNTDEGRQVEAEKLGSVLEKLSENQINGGDNDD